MLRTTESRSTNRRVLRWCAMPLTALLLGGSLAGACADNYPAKDVREDAGDDTDDTDDTDDAKPTRDAGARDAGRDATTRDAGPKYTCPSPATLGECGMCANDSCCEERGVLENDGRLLSDCVQACSINTTCATSCLQRYPALVPFYRAFGQCLNNYCEVECGD
jgi:hypothetical protein